MTSGIIYKMTNKINGKVYIGQTRRTLKARWAEHVRHSRNPQSVILKAIKKYGENNFSAEVIETCSVKNLNERENYWIKYYDSLNKEKGYNIAFDSPVYSKYTKEDKEIIIQLWKKGHTIKEIVEKASFNVETVRLYLNMKGVTKKHIKDRANERNSLDKSKPIYQYSIDGIFIQEWPSIISAAKYFVENNLTKTKDVEVARKGIGRTLNGTTKTTYKYQWRYKQ